MRYWFSRGDWAAFPVLFTLLTLASLINLGLWLSRWLALPLMCRPLPVPARSGWRVGVATTFVPGAESLEMLEETVRALVAMDYPHDTWVLDEGDDPEVKALCRRLGALHFSRKQLPQYQQPGGQYEARSKHGNYNAWLDQIGYARYDIISAFDPDHVPEPAFLTTALGYFDDERIGYVQLPQAYYNQGASFIARGAAEETYTFYSSIQMSSFAMGYPIVVGCHNTHRASALRDVGGFAPHEADDLLITVLYRSRGWNGVYVPIILARGLTPVDWSGYLKQQRRWARSVLDVKLRIYPRVAAQLPLLERVICFVHGLYYLHGITMSVQILVLVLMLLSGCVPAVLGPAILPYLLVLALSVQLCDFYRQRFFLDPRREWGLHWRAGLVQFAKWPTVLVAALDTLLRRAGPYTITSKVRARSGGPTLLWPHLLVAVALAGGWLIGALLDTRRTRRSA